MIVNYDTKGWEVITQRAHGNLAAQLAAPWKVSERPARWAETLVAIADHDDHEMELTDRAALTPGGAPRDYKSTSFNQSKCEKLIELALARSQYVALLTSRHLDFLYAKHAKDNVIASRFLKVQRALRGEWRRSLKINAAEVENIYCLMEWCDALSLIICEHKLPPEHRLLEISTDKNRKISFVKEIEKNVLTVNPWPFEENSFFVHFETKLLPRLRFRNLADFRLQFSEAKINIKHLKFIRTAKD